MVTGSYKSPVRWCAGNLFAMNSFGLPGSQTFHIQRALLLYSPSAAKITPTFARTNEQRYTKARVWYSYVSSVPYVSETVRGIVRSCNLDGE